MRRLPAVGRTMAAVIAVTVIAGGLDAPRSLATLTDASTAGAAIAVETLDPPTGLAGSATTLVTLTWTPTVDVRATGYDVLRSATAGMGGTVVGTVTPGTAATTTDNPGTGTWYYVLRSVFEAWTSLPTDEVAVTLTKLATGFQPCTTNAPDTGGDGDGYESQAGRACVTDAVVASDASSGTNLLDDCASAGKDRHRFWGFALGLPPTAAAIDGIEVKLDAGMNNNGGTSRVCIQLSWDGGVSWTAVSSALLATTAVTTYIVGSPTDTWGRTWTAAELGPGQLRVRLIDASTQPNKAFRLDGLALQVTYRP